MIKALKYFCLGFIFLANFACQEDSDTPKTAEDTLRQYQLYIDMNDFENAKRLSTPKEQIRLSELEKIISQEIATSDDNSSILHTTFHNIQCEKKASHTVCMCDLEDEFERYKQEFRLIQKDDHWLVDAPNEEIIIDDEIIQNAIDSLSFPNDSLEFGQ